MLRGMCNVGFGLSGRDACVYVLMRCRWVALVNGRLWNLCGEWASTDQSLHVWEHRPCGQRADSRAPWGSQCCLCPVCTLLLWLLSPLPDSRCCVRLCLCAYELHSRSRPGFVKPDMPSSSESSRAQTASPLGLMLTRLTFEPPSPVWPKWPGQAARSAFFAGPSQAISGYLCICQWEGTLQGLQILLACVKTGKQAFMCQKSLHEENTHTATSNLLIYGTNKGIWWRFWNWNKGQTIISDFISHCVKFSRLWAREDNIMTLCIEAELYSKG